MRRCRWCNPNNPRYIAYHDSEWGKLSLDEGYLYEMLLLECFQAGLSFECILNKREGFRLAFDHFDPHRVAAYGDADIERLMQTDGIVKNRRKIEAAIQNAAIFLSIEKEFTSFSAYLTSFFPRYPITEQGVITSPISDAISRDLVRRGMHFVGSVTIYSYLQAVGLICSHEKDCFLYHPDERNLSYGTF